MKPKVCLCTFYLAYHKDVPENMSFRQAHPVGCQGTSSHSVYTKTSTDAVQFIIVYVDDILLIGNNKEEMTSSKEWLSSQFSMKDLGEANFVLGIKIFRDRTKRLLVLG